MTETPETTDAKSVSGAAEGRPLGSMRVADLQTIAQGLGIKGAARMRKNVLIEAIEAAQSGQPSPAAKSTEAPAADAAQAPKSGAAGAGDKARGEVKTSDETAADDQAGAAEPAEGALKIELPKREAKAPAKNEDAVLAVEELLGDALDSVGKAPATAAAQKDASQNDAAQKDAAQKDAAQGERPSRGQRGRQQRADQRRGDQRGEQGSDQRGTDQRGADQQGAAQPDTGAAAPRTLDDIILPPARDEGAEEDSTDGRDNQQGGRKRNRNRNRGKGQQQEEQTPQKDESQGPAKAAGRNEDQNGKQPHARQRDRKRNHRDDADPEIAPDDVLLPIAGILDVLDNYAFVRTSGYLAGVNDVYVSLGQVKKYGLRKGDAIVGAIRQPREGEHHGGRQKYNALVRVDTINGEAPDSNRERPDFDKLTPLYPSERIELETENGHAAQRMIDLFAPLGKGTRGLIVAPPKSGKSIMLERIANAIAQNNPDTHLMLVLVDERPEEVTRLERTIHGEVVASTFDMPAENHTTIAELAIERAKRLVELGLDVVVLLDSITQLCRAYNLTAPASGRIIAGGVDASALYPPKRFFGAARKVENGGSLTILATAMVETGSRTDEVILEEFAGTGNMEIRLSREIADKRIFPALDMQQSSTLHEEQLLSPDELEVTWAIRRALHGDAQASLEAVLERISSTSTNEEFLASVRANPISTVNAQ